MIEGRLWVRVVHGRDLLACDSDTGLSDPYC